MHGLEHKAVTWHYRPSDAIRSLVNTAWQGDCFWFQRNTVFSNARFHIMPIGKLTNEGQCDNNFSEMPVHALRGIFELAKRSDSVPVSVADIAAARRLPPRFLEIIFNDLRQAGVVTEPSRQPGGHIWPSGNEDNG